MNQQPDTTTLEGKIAVMQAALKFNRFQHQIRGIYENWCNSYSDANRGYTWNWKKYEHRIHPEDLNPPREKKWRAWKSKEVPANAIIRCKHWPDGIWVRILSAGVEGITHCYTYSFGEPTLMPVYYSSLISNYEYSIDNGKTWQLCGVLE